MTCSSRTRRTLVALAAATTLAATPAPAGARPALDGPVGRAPAELVVPAPPAPEVPGMRRPVGIATPDPGAPAPELAAPGPADPRPDAWPLRVAVLTAFVALLVAALQVAPAVRRARIRA